MKVKAHRLKDERFSDWHHKLAGRWSIEDLRANPKYLDGWISFDCLRWDAAREKLYIGIMSLNTDIFWSFDPTTASFSSLNFKSVSDKFDAKFHRSLELDDDGTYIVATALLHDMDQQFEAAGGKLMRYHPDGGTYELLDIPVPGQYIQSIVLDSRRRLVYGFTYPAEHMFVHDLNTGESRNLAYLGNGRMICQPHNAVLDSHGRVWGTWGENRAFEYTIGRTPLRYFCYDPDSGKFRWFVHGAPKTWAGDTGAVDHMLLGDDGLIYVGTVAGGLSTLDPETGDVRSLGKPFHGGRLAGLVQARDGGIYGAGNSGVDGHGRGTARLFRYDASTGATEDFGSIHDEDLNEGAVNVHMLVEGEDGVLYAGENDNEYRSSHLWRCVIGG